MRHARVKILEWEEFVKILKTVKSAKSASQDKKYVNIKVVGKNILGQRESGDEFKIDIEQLYIAHRQETIITTTVLKKYIKNRTQSPSLAILIEMGIVQL